MAMQLPPVVGLPRVWSLPYALLLITTIAWIPSKSAMHLYAFASMMLLQAPLLVIAHKARRELQ